MGALTAVLLVAAPAAPSQGLFRSIVAETALAQVRQPDPTWEPSQRDCAGLVRFAFRTAFRRLEPGRVKAGLWEDGERRVGPFADAQTLLTYNFVRLGRAPAVQDTLRSGDLLAFRQVTETGEPVYHLMLVVRPEDRAHAPALVVYHPGTPGEAVRAGPLRALGTDAPLEWRPVPENQAFLGYFRFKEWSR